MDIKRYIPAAFSRYNFQKIYSGTESEVYLGLDGDKIIILKHKSVENGGYYGVEGDIYKELEKHGINAPRFIFRNDEENILIISFIEGRELSDNYEMFERKSIWEKVAKDLSSLRNIKCDGFGKIKEVSSEDGFKGSLNNWNEFFKSTFEFISLVEKTDILTTKESELLHKYWSENEKDSNLKEGSIVHGDFCMDHIWTMNGEYAGLIDFGDVFIGDPLMDLAYFKLKEINKDYGKKVFDNLYIPYSYLSGDERSEAEKKKLINLYMIHWGVDRIVSISEDSIRRKFGEKLRVLIQEL